MFFFMQSFDQREAIVDGFQTYIDTTKSTKTYKQDFRPDVLVANTRVVKFGLNLTRANKMVLMEPDASVQIEAQLCKREHRLGQILDVRVYRLVCNDVPQEKAILDQQTMTIGFTSEMYNPDSVDMTALHNDEDKEEE